MSNLKRLKTLFLLNSKVVKDKETDGYKAVCFTLKGKQYMEAMFEGKSPIQIELQPTSPFFKHKEDKLEYLCKKNKSLEVMVNLLQLE